MSPPAHHSSYLAASKHLASGQPREALQLLLKIPAPESEQPEVQLALARCYVALDRHKAAFRIVSALQAAHGPGPWSGLMQQLFEQPTQSTPDAAAAESVLRTKSGKGLLLLMAASLLMVLVAAVAYWMRHASKPEYTTVATEAQYVPVNLTRPLLPEELLSRMDVEAQVDAVYFALLTGLSESDIPALQVVLSEATLPAARERVSWLLGALGDEASVASLIASAQSDTSVEVRRAAVAMLRNFNDESSWRALDQLLKNDPEPEVRWLAAAGMSHLRDRAAQHYIEEAVAREQSPYGKAMLQRLIAPETRGTRPPLIQAGVASIGAFRDTPYGIYIPTSYREGRTLPLLVALGSAQGDAAAMLEDGKAAAEANSCVLLVPYFDYGNYPYFRQLNLVPTLNFVHQRLTAVIAAVRERVTLDDQPPLLFGYGEGAEVAVRFALSHRGKVQRMALHGGDSYLYPDDMRPFPLGLAPHPLCPELPALTFDTLLDTPTLLIYGADDAVASTLETQRLLREAQEYAGKVGRLCRMEGREMPENVHSVTEALPLVADFLFRAP